MDLQSTSNLLKVLADPNRVRLLALLESEELTVAELASVTLLAQPRVSTHLARLREAGLVKDRKSGVQSYYRFNDAGMEDATRSLWQVLKTHADDALLDSDRERLPAILAARARTRQWADSVAGDMERHYSPGRTWEATVRATLPLLELGEVLDIASGDGVLAELLAGQAKRVTCVDVSDNVVEAARRRLSGRKNVEVHLADMHQLPFEQGRFDVVLLMHALTYTGRPADVIKEAARVMRAGGQMVATTLKRHKHKAAVEPYDHQNMGFRPQDLIRHCERAGLKVAHCSVTSRERRAPHFEVITLHAIRP